LDKTDKVFKMTYGRAFSSIDKTYSRKKGKGIKKGALKPLQAKATIYKKREFKTAPHLKSSSKGKGPAPITDKGLRSSRVKAILDGHKKITQQKEDLVRGSSSCINQFKIKATSAFPGPANFPSLNDVDKLVKPYPEIPVAAIQDVAVNQWGVPPEEVQSKQLLTTNSNAQEAGPASQDREARESHGE
jgi:hypothetical protein